MRKDAFTPVIAAGGSAGTGGSWAGIGEVNSTVFTRRIDLAAHHAARADAIAARPVMRPRGDPLI